MTSERDRTNRSWSLRFAATGCSRQAICLLGILLLPGCGGDSRSGASGASGRSIVADPPELLVHADRAVTVETSFQLRNDGKEAVELREVRTPCVCVVPKPTWKARLEPGESTVVSFGARPMSYGVRRTSLTVVTNSAVQPEISIPIEVRGPPLEPPYVRHAPDGLNQRIHPGSGDAELTFAVVCVEKKDDPPWFQACECTLDSTTFTAPEMVKEDPLDDLAVRREYRVTATFQVAEGQPERQSGQVRLKLRSPSMRPVPPIPIHVTDETLIRCTPAALVIRSTERPYGRCAIRRQRPLSHL